MISRVDADPRALDALRQALLSFNSRQVAALDAVLAEAARTALQLEAARERWEQELRRRESALRECQTMAAAAAAAGGGYVDCSYEARAVDEAEDHLREIMHWIREIETATDTYRRTDQRYREYLSSAIPAMRSGLEARAVSLEFYLAWRVQASGGAPSAVDASRAIAVDRATKMKYESLHPPRRPEEVEGPAGNLERRG